MSRAFDTALALINAEIIAEKLGEKIKPVSAPTQLIDLADVPVTDEQTLLDLEGEGIIEKLLIRSPSSNFSITLTTEKMELQGDYTHFEDVCAYKEDDTGTYVLEFTRIEFTQHVRLVLKVGENITFSKIFIKYAVNQ